MNASAEHRDPARRLAIKVIGRSSNGEEVTHFVQARTNHAVARANSLMDKILKGDSNLAVAKKL
jgi:hypothetical protein